VAPQFELRGVFAAAITPHRAGVEGPDFSAMLELVDFLAAGGVRGVCLLGTTGEFLNSASPNASASSILPLSAAACP
jgi:dihydrodipicolinate synthase/N-acetylneuraminate lyase